MIKTRNVYRAPNRHIRMITKGCDTEDLSNGF